MRFSPLSRGAGLARVAAQRLADDRRTMVAAWLVIAVVTTLVAATLQYADTIATQGLRRAVLAAPAATRGVSVTTTAPAASAPALDAAVGGTLQRALGEAAPVSLAARSGSLVPVADVGNDPAHHLTLLGGYADLSSHAQLTAGRWPVPGAQPVEATVSQAAARALGVKLGDRIDLADASKPNAGSALVAEAVVVGTWTADPADPYWLGNELDLSGELDQGATTYRGPLMVDPADLIGRALLPSLTLQWRAGLALDRIVPDDVPRLVGTIPALSSALAVAAPGQPLQLTTDVAKVLADVQASLAVARLGVVLLTVQFLVLAMYALLLIAGLIADRRRRQDRVLQVRGAGPGALLAIATGEDILLAIPAVVVAPFAAALAVHVLAVTGPLAAAGLQPPLALSGPGAIGALATGALAVAILASPEVPTPARLATLRVAIGRESGRFRGRRYVLDLALLAIAALAVWQLRLLGVPPASTTGASGSGAATTDLLGARPLLATGPAIGLLAAALLVTRLLPRTAGAAERSLHGPRTVTAALAAHELARRPQRIERGALLVTIAVGLATLAATQVATWYRSQGDQAAYDSVTDVRAVIQPYAVIPDELLGPAYRALPGVRHATPVVEQQLGIGGSARTATLVAVDAASMAGLPSVRATSPALATSLEQLAARRPMVAATALPGTPRLLAVTLDANLKTLIQLQTDAALTEMDPPPVDIEVDAIVLDADGRAWRFESSEPASFQGQGEHVLIPLLPAPTGQGPGAAAVPDALGALRLEAIEVIVPPPGFATTTTGTIDVTGVAVTDAASDGAGVSWTPVPFDTIARGWGWSRLDGNGRVTYAPPAGAPGRIQVGTGGEPPLLGQYPPQPVTWRAWAIPTDQTGAAAADGVDSVASDRLLSVTGQQVGGSLTATLAGEPLPVRFAAATTAAPPLDPRRPFLIVDGPSLALAAFATGVGDLPATEWWLDASPGAAPAVAAAVSGKPFGDQVHSRATVEARLEADPVALGVVGALLLGAIAALLLGAIGFAVGAGATIDGRGDELGLVRAIGVSDRQALRWLVIEQAAALCLGVLAGILLGVALAWVVLPATTLTPAGTSPVPPAVLDVPAPAIASLVVGAVVLLAAISLAFRRRIGTTDASAALRIGNA